MNTGDAEITIQKVEFTLNDERAIMPIRSTTGSAGYDLFAAEDATIYGGGGMVLIPTFVAAQFPAGMYGSIRPRSGLAYKHHINIGGGVIDRDYYPGNIGVLVYCVRIDYTYEVKRGDRIAQLIVEKIYDESDISNAAIEITSNMRVGGFGSTGK
tara:strand:- start:16749 stop:17213 length:465 start_codon:yes stop_codon:yes gene_type:complete